MATNVHHAKIVMVRPENKPNSIETVDYSNIKRNCKMKKLIKKIVQLDFLKKT